MNGPSPIRPLVSIVVPVYCNEGSLEQLHQEIRDVAASRFGACALEIVFVDDGSTDGSWGVIEALRDLDPTCVSAHRLSRNFGQLHAMLAGYELAAGDAIISISADLQDPTALMGDMVEAWSGGVDVVVANRAERTDGALAVATSRAAYWYARRSSPDIPKGGFDYFLMSRRACDLLLGFRGRFRFLQGDLLWLGLPTAFLPYVRRARPHGKSGYSLRRRLKNFTDLALDASYEPVRVLARVGIVVAVLGFLYMLTIVVEWISGGTPFNGWAPIMVAILILNGLVLLMVGMVGAYVWRIHDEIRHRPGHVVLHSEFADAATARRSDHVG